MDSFISLSQFPLFYIFFSILPIIDIIFDLLSSRIEWLQQGSRELFGTVIEDQITVLIDTSASMASRLFLVKDKLYRLMQVHLGTKWNFL